MLRPARRAPVAALTAPSAVEEDGAMKPSRLLIATVIASLLVVPAAGAKKKPPPPPKKGATYRGSTSQGSVCRVKDKDLKPCTIAMTITGDGTKIKSLVIGWRAGPCSDNPNRFYRSSTQVTFLPVSKAKFRQTGSYTENLADKTKAKNSIVLNGKFKKSSKGKYSASGDFSLVSDLTLPDGTPSHCETGKINWSAKP
jgi:hypothetical protein